MRRAGGQEFYKQNPEHDDHLRYNTITSAFSFSSEQLERILVIDIIEM